MIKKIKHWIRSYILQYKPLTVNHDQWEQQYKSGHWKYLNSFEQLHRYSIIAGTFHFYFGEDGTILDLGCGENILQTMLQFFKYQLYVGVDISETAIEKASSAKSENTKFICKDINLYYPENKFNMIIFNESLYYFENPNDLLRRYSKYLTNNGIILISMWDNKERNNKIWKMIKSNFTTINEIDIKFDNDKSWIIKIISPNSP